MKTLRSFAALLLLTALSTSLWAGPNHSYRTDKARGWHHQEANYSQRSERRAANRTAFQARLAEKFDTDVCDPLIGGTPGLFGRCLSYCKAAELEVDLLERGADAEKLDRLAARKARVLADYNSIREASDPEMPCIQKRACPCWGGDYASTSFWTTRGAAHCDDNSSASVVFKSLSAGQSDNTVNIRAYSNPGVGTHFCSVSDQTSGAFSLQYVSETDAIFCGEQISATCSLLP